MDRRVKVLVVDDDDDIREFVTLALSDEGYDVVTAPNGRVALDRAGKARPDVILLDMQMPIMDGREFASAYRASLGTHAPIIMLTAGHREAPDASYAGVDAYLPKPFNLLALLDLIEQTVKPRQGHALPA